MLSITGGVCFMRLLIAEDEKSLSRALAAILTRNNYSVDTVYDGEAALEYLEATNYDGLILDVMMPGMDGFEVLKTVRAAGNTVPVLMLTARSDVDDRVTGLDLGADDYLTKPFATKELLARVRAITRRVTDASSSQLTLGNVTLDCASFELMCGGQTLRLNRKEFQLLQLFMSYPNQTFSAEHLMQKIWGYESDAEINVVWVNISNLRKKFAALGADIYIRSHRNQGYQIEVKR